MYILSKLDLLRISEKKIDEKTSSFVFEPLSPGYGMTIGNALRRVLLTSLDGAAITSVKIEGVTHEFSTLTGVKEDIIEIILNLKSVRVKSYSEEEVKIKLSKKGPAKVVAGDFSKNAQVEIIDPKFAIANLDKGAKLDMEISINKGMGYIPTEARKDEKLPLGVIAIDSIFTPIKRVHYEVENTRVGGMTNFDKLTIDITTDGAISPKEALLKSTQILAEHFQFITNSFALRSQKSKTKKTSLGEDSPIVPIVKTTIKREEKLSKSNRLTKSIKKDDNFELKKKTNKKIKTNDPKKKK